MPDRQTFKRAHRDAAQGKSPSTQAGEFVREQIHHIRRGLHGARSAKQAIAIGLSEARRAGVKLPPPKTGTASAEVRRKAAQDLRRGHRPANPSRKRSRATLKALQREPHRTVSKVALARQARNAARRRGPRARVRSARKAAATRKKIAI